MVGAIGLSIIVRPIPRLIILSPILGRWVFSEQLLVSHGHEGQSRHRIRLNDI